MSATENDVIEGMLYILGRRALKILPDMFKRGITFPADEADERRFMETLDLKAIKQFADFVQEYTAEQRGEAEKKELKLALRIPGHDLNGLSSNVISLSQLYKDSGKLIHPQEYFRDYTCYRTLVLTMADLGVGGEPDFMTKLPIPQLENLLSQGRINPKVANTTPELKMINSREFVSLYQLVKNVPQPRRREDNSVKIKITIKREESLLVVRDNGPGILDREGNPISAERLPDLFGDYSTKDRGGLGLQLVKALVELPPPNGKRKSEPGYISVSTKYKRGPSLFYSTGKGNPGPLEKDLVQGTEFTLCFRH